MWHLSLQALEHLSELLLLLRGCQAAVVGERLLILFIGFLDMIFADAQVQEDADVAQFFPSQPRTVLRTGGGQAGSLSVIPDGRGYAEHSAQHRVLIRRSCDMPFWRNRAHPPPHREGPSTRRSSLVLPPDSAKAKSPK